MRRSTPEMRKYAEALLTQEAREPDALDAKRPVALLVCERMRPHMATLMGTYGFHALLSRSLALGSLEAPWLSTLRVLPSGVWDLPERLETKITTEQLAEGNVVLVAHLLGLLVALLGEDLTLRQLHEIWSKNRPRS